MDPAEVPTTTSGSLMSMPPSLRPLMRPISQASPVTLPPPNTSARSIAGDGVARTVGSPQPTRTLTEIATSTGIIERTHVCIMGDHLCRDYGYVVTYTLSL